MNNGQKTTQLTVSIPPPVGALLSIIPGLGQMVAGYFTRGFLLMLMIVSLVGLAYWRMADSEMEISLSEIQTEGLNAAQRQAATFAILVIFFTVLTYLWNIYYGYACARGKPSPSRMAFTFLTIATLIIGAHITEIDILKAIRERSDVVPRLEQILWPWGPTDAMWEREIVSLDASGRWEAPCDETPIEQIAPADESEPYLLLDPPCGVPSGQRKPDGTREDGTLITVHGYNLDPGMLAEVIVKPSSIPEFRVIADGERVRVTPGENGEVEFEFIMPNFVIPSTAVGSVPVIITVRQEEEIGSLRPSEDFWLALEGIIETLFLALMATAAGLILAVPMSFVAARNLMATNIFTVSIYYIVRLIMNVVRSIEPLIWALIAIIWVGPGPFAGVIALTLHTIASLGKLYSESIESIDPGPIEAIQATGANRLQTIIYAVVPQVVPPFVSFTIYRWDINVRMSTIIGAVGGGGIGFILIQWIRLAKYDSVGIAVWMIAIVVTILDYISARIRENYV